MSGPNDWIRKKNSAPGSGQVGYGRPPVAGQFKPGQSGNPRGRKKGVKNVATIFNDALYKPVKIRTAGRVKTLPRIEAIVEVTLNKALAGDSASFSRVIELAHKLGGFEFLANSTSSSPNSESARDRLARLIAAYSGDGVPLNAPGPNEGTPESNSDKKKGEE